MKALILNCTLKLSPEVSNTEALARVVQNALVQKGVATEMIRVVDLNIRPGVKTYHTSHTGCNAGKWIFWAVVFHKEILQP